MDDDFRLAQPIYDYHDLYINNNCLCGLYNVAAGNNFYGVTTFEIPIFKNKKLSPELVRFLNRSQDLNHLLKNVRKLQVKNKSFLDLLLKNKKVPKVFKKYFQNFELLQ